MDLFDKCSAFTMVEEAKKHNVYPYFPVVSSRQTPEAEMNGRRTILLGSSNYLGLANDERIIATAKEALDKYGSGCTGSRALNGTTELHVELEMQLADFTGKPAAMAFSTGFQTNLGILSAIAGEQDIIFSDSANHDSLVDGARLSYGAFVEFSHNDMMQLEQLLSQADPGKGKLIVVDGVYSADGTLPNLPELVRLKKQYRARLMVDDSHGVGVMGNTGRGVGEYFNLMNEIDIYMGTFSKAFASLGGFIASETKVIEYVSHVSRPFISTAALPPPNVAVVLKAMEILKAEPERVHKTHENAAYMRKRVAELGIPVVESIAPIISFKTGSGDITHAMAAELLRQGVYANPMAADGLLRTCYSSSHTQAQLDIALEKIDTVFNMFTAAKEG